MTSRKKLTAGRFLARFSLVFFPILAGSLYLFSLTLPPSRSIESQTFVVESGETAQSIATHLQEAGLLRSPLYFRLLVKRGGYILQAGTYSLSPAASPQELARLLTSGHAPALRFTVPEGFRLEEIAASLPSTLSFSSTEFLSLAKGLEGRLFPDTYFLPPSLSAEALISLMQENFTAKVGELDEDTLIIASLVERETKGDAEKSVVAGILVKRLAAGWPLELDATVQYALGREGEWWPITTLADREVKSLYNTYLHLGLPPTPICNPGLASIQAARSPEDSPYWFYLHDSEGRIHYGATVEEQAANITTYLR